MLGGNVFLCDIQNITFLFPALSRRPNENIVKFARFFKNVSCSATIKTTCKFCEVFGWESNPYSRSFVIKRENFNF
jgi:competence transcription factor ComK